MAGSVNKVILVGNLGRDPEIRQTNSGQRVANLNIATSDQWTDKQSGERRERTEWHRIVIFDDRLVDVAEKYLKKGSKVFVEGSLQTRKFQDQSGQDRYMTEVVLQRFRGELQMLDTRAGGGADYGGGGGDATRQDQDRVGAMDTKSPAPGPGGNDDLDDEIPF